MNTYPQYSATTLMTAGNSSSGYVALLKVVPLALVVTAGLVVFMERLVHMTEVEIDETPTVPVPEVVWTEKIIETIIDKKPAEPKPIEQPPVIPETPLTVTEGPSVVVPSHKFNVDLNHKMSVAIQDNMPIAQFLAAAKYPARALQRGIEGYVDVMFDVTEYGGTDNIEVLAAFPDGVFEQAAVKAVASWRFQPQVYDSKPVRFEGMKRRVRFEIQKNNG